jgi:hypothetical protein
VITYDGLPVSAGGAHRIRSKDRIATWAALEQCLTAFTTYIEPNAVGLLLAEGERVDQRFGERARHASTAIFGGARRRVVVTGVVEEHEYRWLLAPADVGPALSLMRELEPFPAHWRDAPLTLQIEATFQLRDPDSGAVFPGQDASRYDQDATWQRPLGASQISVRMSTSSACNIFLSLPFAEVTPAVSAYASRLSGALPFRLSPKHWLRWQLNASGTRYYSRRVSVLGR